MFLRVVLLRNFRYSKVEENIQVSDNMDELEAIKVPPIQSSPFDELATKPEHYKYFRCKHGDWNIVKTEDILPLKHLAKESKRKITIHSEVNYDVGIAFKKFS